MKLKLPSFGLLLAASGLAACNNAGGAGGDAAKNASGGSGLTGTDGRVVTKSTDSGDSPSKPASISGAYLVAMLPSVAAGDTHVCAGVQVRGKDGVKLAASALKEATFSYLPPAATTTRFHIDYYDMAQAGAYYYNGVYCMTLAAAAAGTPELGLGGPTLREQQLAYFVASAPVLTPKRSLLSDAGKLPAHAAGAGLGLTDGAQPALGLGGGDARIEGRAFKFASDGGKSNPDGVPPDLTAKEGAAGGGEAGPAGAAKPEGGGSPEGGGRPEGGGGGLGSKIKEFFDKIAEFLGLKPKEAAPESAGEGGGAPEKSAPEGGKPPEGEQHLGEGAAPETRPVEETMPVEQRPVEEHLPPP